MPECCRGWLSAVRGLLVKLEAELKLCRARCARKQPQTSLLPHTVQVCDASSPLPAHVCPCRKHAEREERLPERTVWSYFLQVRARR